MNQPKRLFHGGIPGLRRGDLIEPGHDRQAHDGCQWCAARPHFPMTRPASKGTA
jgi:hypothetical protein